MDPLHQDRSDVSRVQRSRLAVFAVAMLIIVKVTPFSIRKEIEIDSKRVARNRPSARCSSALGLIIAGRRHG